MQVASNNTQANQATVATPVATAAVPKVSTPKKKEKKGLSLFSKKGVPPKKIKNPSAKKQIPTILGLLILIFSLGAGVLLFGNGTGVFAPRANAESTPKNIRVSNVTDKTFTVSFYTDEETIAFVKYGKKGEKLTEQTADDRDQLSGIVKAYRLHHITVRGLDAGSDYEYILGTGSDNFDNAGENYSIKTAVKPGTSPQNNQTIYGNIVMADQTPAEGAIVYLYHENMGTMSTLVKSSGTWGLSLSNAFSSDGSNYANLTDESKIQIKLQGIEPSMITNWQTTVAEAQPVQELILGAENAALEVEEEVDSEYSDFVNKEELLASESATTNSSSSGSAEINLPNSTDTSMIEESSSSGALGGLLEEELVATPVVLDLSTVEEDQEASATTVTTTQPVIKTTLPANTTVRVEIHSDTQIDQTLQTDENGELIVDVSSLGQDLEPGEHTASYTYIDPITGEEVTKTYNFTVDPVASTGTGGLLAAATTTPTIPYGSGNPYVPTTTPSTILTATPTAIFTATPTAVASTSAQYEAGSVGTTLMLLIVGFFFVGAGLWSYFLAHQFED